MVSVKRCTLNSEYIEAAQKLISALSGNPFHSNGSSCILNNGKGYNIDYAYFYLRYDDDQEWYSGDWWLFIATNDLNHDHKGTRIVLDTIKSLDIDLPEFDFEICSPSVEDYLYQSFNKIVIKEYIEI
ncbi:MAG: hypothetical protein PHG06_00615 [Parabacteroides sp.]|nr:hypothetical protein [Parabacteroides sp.]